MKFHPRYPNAYKQEFKWDFCFSKQNKLVLRVKYRMANVIESNQVAFTSAINRKNSSNFGSLSSPMLSRFLWVSISHSKSLPVKHTEFLFSFPSQMTRFLEFISQNVENGYWYLNKLQMNPHFTVSSLRYNGYRCRRVHCIQFTIKMLLNPLSVIFNLWKLYVWKRQQWTDLLIYGCKVWSKEKCITFPCFTIVINLTGFPYALWHTNGVQCATWNVDLNNDSRILWTTVTSKIVFNIFPSIYVFSGTHYEIENESPKKCSSHKAKRTNTRRFMIVVLQYTRIRSTHT